MIQPKMRGCQRLITRLFRQGRLATDKVSLSHSCSFDSAVVARFCTDDGLPFDGENFDARAKYHEKMTGHSVREHVFCNQCHRPVAVGVKIQGKYYWSIAVVSKHRHAEVRVERVITEHGLRLVADQAG